MNQPLIPYPSNNFDDRPTGSDIKYLIYHYTAGDLELSLKWLSDSCTQNPVSAHYLICEEGKVFQLVADEKRAWHAGVSSWGDDLNLNATSLGIELVNPGHGPNYCHFPELQMKSLILLSRRLIEKYQISPFHILGHSDIAPSRKVDPGELFDWEGFARLGIGVYPLTIEGGYHYSISQLQVSLREYGYSLEVTGEIDEQTNHVLRAFQMHYGGNDLASIFARLEWLLREKDRFQGGKRCEA